MKKLQIFFSILIFAICKSSYSNELNEQKLIKYLVDPIHRKNTRRISITSDNYESTINEIDVIRRHFKLKAYPSYVKKGQRGPGIDAGAEINYLEINAKRDDEFQYLAFEVFGTIKSPIMKTIKILKRIKELEKEKLNLEIKNIILNSMRPICSNIMQIKLKRQILDIYDETDNSLNSIIKTSKNFQKVGLLSEQNVKSLELVKKNIQLKKMNVLSDIRIIKLGIKNEYNIESENIDTIGNMLSAITSQVENNIFNSTKFKNHTIQRSIDSLYTLINIENQKKQFVNSSKIKAGPFYKKYTNSRNYEFGIGVDVTLGKRCKKFNNTNIIDDIKPIGSELTVIKDEFNKNISERYEYIKNLELCLDEVIVQTKHGQIQSISSLNGYINKIMDQKIEICNLKLSYDLLLLEFLNTLEIFGNGMLKRYINHD